MAAAQEVLLADTEVNSRATCYLSPCRYLEMMLEPDGTVFFDREHIVPYDVLAAPDFETFYHRVMRNLSMIVNAVAWHYNGFVSAGRIIIRARSFPRQSPAALKRRRMFRRAGQSITTAAFALGRSCRFY